MGYVLVDGKDFGDVRVFSLSTCAWCNKLKRFLERRNVKYRYIDLDTADEEERQEIVEFLDSIYEKWGFPSLLFDERVLLCGYKESDLLETLGLDREALPVREEPEKKDAPWEEEVERIYANLKRVNEKKGYYLNPDTHFAKKLIRGLLDNQRKYGYWACPCRLASGNRTEDQDIICPCVYREPDVLECGSCYCGLFVSEEVAKGLREVRPVPERRHTGNQSVPPDRYSRSAMNRSSPETRPRA